MPPRKKINASENDTQPKMPKRKQRLPLKISKMLLSEFIIPTTMPNTKPKLTRQKKNKLEKQDLESEVAAAQLINQPIVIDNVAESCASQEKIKLTRQKKNKLEKLDLANEATAQLIKQPIVIDNVAEGCVSQEKTKLTRQKKNKLEKLVLANEVATAQLINQPIVIDNVAKSCVSQEETKQTRQKKNKLEKMDLANEVARVQLINQPIEIDNVADSCASQEQTKIKIKEEIEEPSKPARKSRRKRNTGKITVFPSKFTRKRKVAETAEKCEPKQKMSKQITNKSTVVKNSRVLRSSKENKDKQNDGVENEVSSILDLDTQVVKDENDDFLCDDGGNIENTTKNKSRHCIDNSENLSWTKDISNSSSTTCITANSSDVVSINGKLPVLKLTDIKHNKNNAEKKKIGRILSESETSCGGSAEFTSDSEMLSSNRNLATGSLRLSFSSTNSICDNEDTKENVNKIEKKQTLEQLSQILKTFDLEFVNWVAYENENTNPNMQKLTEQIFEYLKEENEILASLKRVKSVLLESNGNKSPDPPNETEVGYRYSSPIVTSDGETNFNKKIIINDVSLSKANNDIISDEDVNDFTDSNFQYVSFDNNDNDDSISLFAESITGMESSNMSASESVSNVRKIDNEEYIPQPLSTNWKSPEFTYQPTKITEKSRHFDEIDTKLSKGVCEKQNADSTSINRELINKDIAECPEKYVEDLNIDLVKRAKFMSENIDSNLPHLLKHLNFYPVSGVKSVIFKGVCFYNLISKCKKTNCHFPHTNIDIHVLLQRLSSVSNHVFVTEYMLIREWPNLRRMYSIFFVKKCIEKKLTRVLIEMAIDSVIKANTNHPNDEVLKVHIIEHTLLYLNNIDLKKFEDLLKYDIGNDTFLCDVFMQIIAETQNFSRFKTVFVNLTPFVISLERGFKLNVAKHILERVCILPPDVQIYSALLKIIKHTDRSIFGSRVMGHFENQLCTVNTELYNEFLDYKNQVEVDHTLGVCPMDISPRCSQEPEIGQTTAVVHAVNGNRYLSPDTTNVDGSINVQNHSHVSPNTADEHNLNSPPKPFYRSPMKRFQRTFNNNIRMPFSPLFRPPAPRPHRFQHRVAFRGPLPNFRGRPKFHHKF